MTLRQNRLVEPVPEIVELLKIVRSFDAGGPGQGGVIGMIAERNIDFLGRAVASVGNQEMGQIG